ncbi:MAG: D-alanyl-D-alanine carboxypeptidase [Chitinophagia bacterium]
MCNVKWVSILSILVFLNACSLPHSIQQTAKQQLLSQPELQSAHVGIAVMDAATGNYLYNYQSNKYFIPASNTKLYTCFAAMKYLGDSLIALRYVDKGSGIIELEGNGDPTFLHPGFPNQPAFQFLQKQSRILFTNQNWREPALGAGWAWDDYKSDYMQERTVLPIYGNLARFQLNNNQVLSIPTAFKPLNTIQPNQPFTISRNWGSDSFYFSPASKMMNSVSMPFHIATHAILAQVLADTLHSAVEPAQFTLERWPDVITIKSQPTDSVLSMMMHESDNFFAEQILLMVGNDRFAVMNTKKIIDSLLATDLSILPQKPKWIDGSGLSRYNLFTPQDMVTLLQLMQSSFSWKRITAILPTGNEGTLGGLYTNYAGKIYAKTGTLGNQVALSGYVLTNKGKRLIFSVMVNAHQSLPQEIRKKIEGFLTQLIDKN